ncbi:Uncharacterized protein BP5553_06200 [Venustampulla echinocandica]|uniref:DUF7924 domain-containing protein n=1 Tax=Venustampulla echinocandica TaxID=2656787 RepID=A0A370TMW4_9HELO|nr:Uncharacterized protein BP5553_06200 [Venustampulla echinocandica]RDL36848.1 Uncharacterized protein BP5553_06200 [Venustampulla echinocandica]
MAPRQKIPKVERQRSVPKYEKARPQGIKKEPPQLSLRKSKRLQLLQERTIFKGPESRKRKRSQEDEASLSSVTPPQKQLQTSSPVSHIENTIYENIAGLNADLVTRWIEGKPWPKEYFEQESTVNSSLRTKTSSSSPRMESEMTDGSGKEGKNPAVRSRLYEVTLAKRGIYLEGGPGITDDCRALCKSLLEAEQSLPPDSLFRDDRLEKTCERLRNENEAKVIRDISSLLVPSVEVLCAYGDDYLEFMVDHVNQRWFGCVPIVLGPTPQPDYSAGCKATIFTKGQLRKLEPFIKRWKRTLFLATAWMYFPYLTVEVKCGNEGLNIADRQNAHSSGVAVKQVVDLYRKVSRQHELNRKILAFSISHNHVAVRIYGYYPVIDGDQTSIYRYSISQFDIRSNAGKDRWASYIFTRNLYDSYSPIHFERLRSAVDQLPDPVSDYDQSQQSDLELLSRPDKEESQSDIVDYQDLLKSAPSSQISQPSFKKPGSKRS